MDTIEMIVDSEESIQEFHKRGWGRQDLVMTQDQLKEFINGKLIAIDDGEYTHVIKLIK